MAPPGQLRIRLLGGLAVEGVAERDLGSRKGRTLLKLLTLARGVPVPVDRAAEVLWGDHLPAQPAEQVGVLVSRLRRALGATRVVRSDGGYALVVDWLDLDELADRTAEAVAALAHQRLAAARAAADSAMALVRGPVLADEEGLWAHEERAAALALVQQARQVALDAAMGAGDHGAAAALAETVLAHDPYDEAALRALMRAHLASARPASALAAYARVRERLADDLGVSPTAETEALHDDVLARGDAAAAPMTSPGAPSVRLAGRGAELARLDDALAAAAGGGGITVQVVGVAGIGKSTLVEAWSSTAAPRGHTVLVGRCDELGRDLPLQPVVDALAARVAGLGAAARDELLGDDARVLAPLLGVTAPEASGATVIADADVGRMQLYAALLAAIDRAGGDRPTVLVIEDLHLGGRSTLAWLAFASRRPARLLVVVTSRPGAPTLPGALVVTLGPVDLATAVELVGEGRAADVHRRSGGHPLLLMALASAGADEVPATVVDAVEGWLVAVGAAGRTVEAAAVLGADIDLDLLAEVLRRPAGELLGDLEAAVAVGLLVERGPGFAFRHELVRVAVDATVSSARSAFVHRAAAQALQDRPQVDPLAVAIHARLGGDAVLAAEAFVAAAEVAASRFELDGAQLHLDAAIDLMPTPEALTARARLRTARFDLSGAARDARAALDAGGGAATLEVTAWIAYYQRRYVEAQARADEGVARATDVTLRTSCLAIGGRARHGAGDLRGGADRLAEAAAAGAPAPFRGVAEVWLAHARLHQGRPVEALAAAERGLLDRDRLAHPFAALHGAFARVLALGQLGRAAEALVAADELDRAADGAGEVGARFRGPAANSRAWVLRWTGRTAEADEHNQAGVEATYANEAMQEAHYAALLDLADGRLLMGDFAAAAAIEVGLATMETWAGTMAWYQRHRLGVLRARLALADADRDTAAAHASVVVADAAERGARRHELLASAVLGLAGGLAPASLDEVVVGLRGCAGLDGWRSVGELARAFDVDRWRQEAERGAASLVAASDRDAEAARTLVDRVLG